MRAVESLKSIRLKVPVVAGPPGSIARREWVAGEGVACFLSESGLVLLEVDVGEGGAAMRYRKAWALASGDVEVEFAPVPVAEEEEASNQTGLDSSRALRDGTGGPGLPSGPLTETAAPKRRGRPPKAASQD